MKLKDVRTHVLEAALREPFSWSLGWARARTALLVEIEVADGSVGWGESYGPARPNAAMVEAMAAFLIGTDALATPKRSGSGCMLSSTTTARRDCRCRRCPRSTSRSGISRAGTSASRRTASWLGPSARRCRRTPLGFIGARPATPGTISPRRRPDMLRKALPR